MFAIETKSFKVILFDLDGTLIDNMQSFAIIAAKLLNRYTGLPLEYAYEKYLETSGVPFLSQLSLIIPGHPEIEFINAIFEREKLATLDEIRMDDNTIMALREIRRLGIKFGISSNNYHANVISFVRSSPIEFDFALGYTSTLKKGTPHLSYISRVCQCSIEDMLFIGDSLADATTALECNVSFVAITNTISQAQFAAAFPGITCIPNIVTLLDLLDPDLYKSRSTSV